MSHFSWSSWPRCLAGCIAVTLCTLLVVPRLSADPLSDASSLKFAPADASIYVSGMRMREIFDKVAASKAVAKLKSMPSVQFGLAMAAAQWQNPQSPQLVMLKQMLANPDNQQLVEMLKDAVSQEVFFYGDQTLVDAASLMMELNAAINQAQLEALESGDFENMQSYPMEKMVEVLDQKGDQLKVPRLLTGMKLSDTKAALAQLQRLEALLQGMLQQNPALQSRFSRQPIGGGEFLILQLDGTLIPWPPIDQNRMNIDPEVQKQLIEKVSALKMVIALGVRDGYLLLSMGPDNDHLASLGKGALLYDREEMAPVRQAADKPIVEVVYADAELLSKLSSVNQQLDQVVTLVKQFAPGFLAATPELQEELIADVEKLAEYIKQQIPAPGTVTGYQYLTAEGVEGYTYNWGGDSGLDTSQELPILRHLGGNPLAFWAARGKTDPQDLEDLLLFLSRLSYYGEQFAMQQLDETQLDSYERLKTELLPMLNQLATVTREKLGPALEDGQYAIVLDAKSTSEAWHQQLPPAGAPLPMLELGVIMGVSDAGLVEETFSEYFKIAQGILDKLHELSTGDMQDVFPNPIGPIKLVKPTARAVDGGTVYYRALPPESGVDKQLAPNGGLSQDALAFSLLPLFTARLLADTPLQGSGPLANVERPLGAAFHLDFAALVTAATPWVDYALSLSMPPDQGVSMLGNVPQQVHDVLDVLQCFQGVSGVTYAEGDATVTHAQWRFVDLP